MANWVRIIIALLLLTWILVSIGNIIEKLKAYNAVHVQQIEKLEREMYRQCKLAFPKDEERCSDAVPGAAN